MGNYTNQNEPASLIVVTKSHLITAGIDVKQKRNVMTAEIPNALIQTKIKSNQI